MSTAARIDEVSRYYKSARQLDALGTALFWAIAALSLLQLFDDTVPARWLNMSQVPFIVLVVAYALLSLSMRIFFVPRAERMRRKQMLSDSLGAALSTDKTSNYYNNPTEPSIIRLGVNTMENAFFSKGIASKMLLARRWITIGYLFAWIITFALRQTELELLMWITQFVFSGEIVLQWLSLEALRQRNERTYETLHYHFLNTAGDESTTSIATILDAFADYESAKSTAGLLLSEKVFEKENARLSARWSRILSDLNLA